MAALVVAGCDRPAATEAARVESASPAPSPSPSPDRSAFVAAVDAVAAEALQRGPIAGLSIAVFEHGRPVLAKGYGFADIEEQSRGHRGHLVPDRVRLQALHGGGDPAPGRSGPPRPRRSAEPLLPRGPAAHRRVDPASPPRPHVGADRGRPAPRAAAVSVLARGGTALGPGQDWDYSNYNFSLLGLVIEQASGRDYAQYVHDEIAAPLGLTGTGYCEEGQDIPGRGRDYLSGRKIAVPDSVLERAPFLRRGRAVLDGAGPRALGDGAGGGARGEPGRCWRPCGRRRAWPAGSRPTTGSGRASASPPAAASSATPAAGRATRRCSRAIPTRTSPSPCS